MKLKVIFLIALCAFFSEVKSQENTTYFFMGHVFSINENDEEIERVSPIWRIREDELLSQSHSYLSLYTRELVIT